MHIQLSTKDLNYAMPYKTCDNSHQKTKPIGQTDHQTGTWQVWHNAPHEYDRRDATHPNNRTQHNMKTNTLQHSINSVIEQADWIAGQSNYENVNDLWQSDPDLFITLAAEYREGGYAGAATPSYNLELDYN